MITRYGYTTVAQVALITIGGSLLAWFRSDLQWMRVSIVVLFFGFLLFTISFFRDPERTTPEGENLIIAPADGKIVGITNLRDDEFLKGDAIQVSIFMSPLNVHVNRYPVSGTVKYYRYIPGEYLVAFDEKSSLRNERTHIGIDTGKNRVLFKQIAGFVARRIVAEVSEGSTAKAGERFGMIRFGSRVDLLIPRTCRLLVRSGDHTVAGETVVAEAT